MITMSRCTTGSFQGFTSFISTPDFTNDEAHQPHSYPHLVNLGIVGLHGDPNVLNKALKYLGTGYFKMCQKGHSLLLPPPPSVNEGAQSPVAQHSLVSTPPPFPCGFSRLSSSCQSLLKAYTFLPSFIYN